MSFMKVSWVFARCLEEFYNVLWRFQKIFWSFVRFHGSFMRSPGNFMRFVEFCKFSGSFEDVLLEFQSFKGLLGV